MPLDTVKLLLLIMKREEKKSTMPRVKEEKVSSKEKEIPQFLRHIGDDVVPDGVVASPECEGQGEEEGFCPAHKRLAKPGQELRKLR